MTRTILPTASALIMVVALAGCAAPACRTGFDIGSSGIRAGATSGDVHGRVSVDYLADVWADNVIDQTVEATVTALRDLAPNRDCLTLAGAYSAWRLAVEKGGAELVADTLTELRRRTGVAVYVIPQAVEGRYGYFAAKQQLGERLATPLVLDIGGGSLQFAASDTGWGTALGQKAWRKLFCTRAKAAADADCAANPVGADAVAQSRRVLAPELAEAKAALGTGLAVTAVSPPVVRGIHPILGYLARRQVIVGQVDATGFDRPALDSAIARLAAKDDADILRELDDCGEATAKPHCAARHVATFVTDMLLLRTFMEGLAIDRLEVAEADLTNVPGLLADDRAVAWAQAYPCYLARLRAQGVAAYLSDPGNCR